MYYLTSNTSGNVALWHHIERRNTHNSKRPCKFQDTKVYSGLQHSAVGEMRKRERFEKMRQLIKSTGTIYRARQNGQPQT